MTQPTPEQQAQIERFRRVDDLMKRVKQAGCRVRYKKGHVCGLSYKENTDQAVVQQVLADVKANVRDIEEWHYHGGIVVLSCKLTSIRRERL